MPAQIFGRNAELEAIGAFLSAVARSPGALVLAGPAGAGKTTLLRAGATLAADHGFTVLQTAPARGDLRLAFAGLADLLEPYLDAVIDEMPPPQARALRVALLLEEAPAHPPQPRLIAAAFRAAVGALARSAPVLVIIDDVQWLDPPSQAAVGFAIRRLEHEPAGMLCAQRTDRPGAELPLELGRARLHADFLPVGRMSIGALHRLLHTRLSSSFSHPTLRRIEAGSDGNPFIALEIGRALARRGISSAGPPASRRLRPGWAPAHAARTVVSFGVDLRVHREVFWRLRCTSCSTWRSSTFRAAQRWPTSPGWPAPGQRRRPGPARRSALSGPSSCRGMRAASLLPGSLSAGGHGRRCLAGLEFDRVVEALASR
jgi:AAA ATPase domain